MSEAWAAPPAAEAPAVNVAALRQLGRSAIAALYEELALHPKPGLVSFADTGSHSDMNAGTFMRSLFALRHCFPALVIAGARNAHFEELETQGIAAEQVMLRATGGINTHRGAIFSLGMLCAAAGRLHSQRVRLAPAALQACLLHRWGPALQARCAAAVGSHGQIAAQHYGLRSARQQAALGFPALFDVTLPALQRARASGLDASRSRLQALFETMAVLDDTNLAHRGGLEGLRWVQACATAFLAYGGAAHPAALCDAARLNAAFVARNLSPGGSADLLAAACCVDRWCPNP